jgi:peptidyl-prolyl cis-trans isomerase D
MTGLTRGGFINGVPQEVVAQAFEIAEPGETAVVDADNRVFLVTLDAIHPAASDDEEAQQVRDGIDARLADSMRQDVFRLFHPRACRRRAGVTLNQTAIDAVNAQVQ